MHRLAPALHAPIMKKHAIFWLGLLTLIYALLMPDSHLLWKNYMAYVTAPTHLLQDTFAIAGLAGGFFNAALHFFTFYALMLWNNQINLNGFQFSALGIFVGHSFIGTHIFNILPLILGVVLFARWTNQSFKRFTSVSMFTGALAPIVSFVAIQIENPFISIVLAIFIGLFLGFIAPPLAEHFLKFHQGFSLYNFGFTTGMVAMFVAILLPYFDLAVTRQATISTDAHPYILIYLSLLLLCCTMIFFIQPQQSLANIKRLIKSSGRLPEDFVSKYDVETVALNGVVTVSCYIFLLILLNATFNGPILCSLLTILGFSAFGKHLFNCLPISLGVFLAALLIGEPLTSTNVLLSALLGTTLAPIAGFYGVIAGLIAGFLHFNLTSTVALLHQGLTLYNNGFSGGFVAAFLVPIIDNYLEHQPNK